MPNRKTEQPWERQKGESAQAFEAFSLYLEMGAERNIRAVAQELHKSYTIIARWSRTNNWVERCRAWDNHLQREAKKAAVAEIRKMNQRHIDMARALQGAVAKALKDRGATIITDKNLAAIAKLGTDLERSCRVYEAEAAMNSEEHREQAEDDPLTAALKEDMDNGLF